MQDDSLFGDMAEDSSEIFDLDGDGYAEAGISYVIWMEMELQTDW
jgi:hypothetical protein